MGLFTYDLDLDAAALLLQQRLAGAAAFGGSLFDADVPGTQQQQQQQQARPRRSVVRTVGLDPLAEEVAGVGPDAGEPTLTGRFDDDWEDNPDLLATWGLTAEFKQAFDGGFQVGVAVCVWVWGRGCACSVRLWKGSTWAALLLVCQQLEPAKQVRHCNSVQQSCLNHCYNTGLR